jgi:hypothetical protein
MKITTSKLKHIIKEELQALLAEASVGGPTADKLAGPNILKHLSKKAQEEYETSPSVIADKEEQEGLEESLMDRILSLTPDTEEMKGALSDLAWRAPKSREAAQTLVRLKDQYARKVATGEGDGKWARMARAVYDNMTRG